ncbi:DMT family transporter [Desulfosporosinus sp.]|uniref:DMT family transporter n=1 Tax=Desulfosporosinus sp. TaxID=157907 RepID=UPI002324F9BA|nr:DMT family transporter [Desulfosporosinus sp.]MCO5387349.1 DMT family transporter [Desulfosporosinus sp.]MDA8222292.1 DMT family transporter [Desulfitobacterium hafniense]
MALNTAKNVQVMQTAQELGHAKKGLVYGVISGATWGLDGVILGMALAMAPFTGGATLSVYAGSLAGAAMHDGFAGFWLFFYNLFTGRASEYFRTLRTRPGKVVVLAALFGGPIAMSGYLLGINMAGASYALAITAMYPAVGAILAVFVLKEKIIPRVWAGIILCVGGAVVVGYVPPAGDFPDFYLGLAFSLLATLGWGMEGVLSTYGMDMADPDIAIGIREATSFFVYLIGILPIAAGVVVFWDAFKEVSVYYVAGAGALGALSYVCWYRALNMTGVGRAMALNVTYALWAVFFSWLLIPGFKLTVTLVVGAVIITLGTILVTANPKELLKLRKV